MLRVQHHAFGRVASGLKIDPEALPPLRESLEDLVALFEQGVRFYIAESDGEIVGSVRAQSDDATVEVGRLVVEDGWTRRGVATALMRSLEADHPDAARFELFTGAEAHAPLQLYAKLGYRETKREDIGPVVLVWLEKTAHSEVP